MRVRVVVDWLEHDRRRCVPGEVLELDDAAAQALVTLGVVEPAEKGGHVPRTDEADEQPVVLPRSVGRRRRAEA